MSEPIDVEKLATESKVVAAGRPAKQPDGALNPPIALNSTFHQGGPVGYGRYGNETWSALEEAISVLEGGKTLLFSSGMAAISAVFSLLPKGAVIVAAKNGY
jgi:cystathionine gamma-synthase